MTATRADADGPADDGTDVEASADTSVWTTDELAAVRAALEADVARLRQELAVAATDIAGQMRDSVDDTGDEVADVGTFASDLGAEASLADNSRDILAQSERALERIASARYGRCESCDGAIAKARLQVFPRATQCLRCRQGRTRR
ncbi:MAG: TraR/DksA family transcriptional regulator [Nocardioidaceae bacterium]